MTKPKLGQTQMTPDVIQAQFINGLKCDLTLTPTADSAPSWSSLVTRDSLTALGAAVKATLPEIQLMNAATDLQEGFNNYNVSLDNVMELLANPIFENRYMLALGKTEWADHKWTKQSSGFKRTLINRPHFVFTAADSPAAYERSRSQLEEVDVNAKLIDGSDAHHLSTADQSTRLGNCMTWINALPSFEGLRHAYHEFETRVFVGDRPPKLESVRAHPTHHIDVINVRLAPGQQSSPSFETQLPVNSGFVAIVGNKGQGKSALTDIIGLLGGTSRSAHNSFLTPARFKDPKNNLASKHEASMSWLGGDVTERSLDADPDSATTEAVQYLPQSFLESVCNEGPGSDKLFSLELEQVIFAHVPQAERMGTTNLADLIAARTGATQRRIEILRGELSATITRVLDLEAQLEPRAKKELESQLAEKSAELTAHDALKPEPVAPPADHESHASELEQRIEEVRRDVGVLEDELRLIQTEANDATRLLGRAEELGRELDNLQHQVTTFVDRISPIAAELGVKTTDLLTFSTSLDVLDQLVKKLADRKDAALSNLSTTADGTPAKTVVDSRTELTTLESALDAPQRAYQAYLSQVDGWKNQRLDILGSPGTAGSLEFFQHRLAELSKAPMMLDELREQRLAESLAIHAQLLEVATEYRSLYAPVQTFIDEHPVVRNRFNLAFEVTVEEDGLTDQFFTMVSRQAAGSFYGTEDGNARLAAPIAVTDFGVSEAVGKFVSTLDNDLRHDGRPGRKNKRSRAHEQLRKGATSQQLYELIFGLRYLKAEFSLESDSRPLTQLSPGQRGTLLLLFYLLVDKSHRPIVLDQPEENLDNQTVHELLVPAIAEARKLRQVIVVTHNPNLAVVGDADQVIVADLDNGRFQYVSGAIEDPVINGRIVKILEGTWPAFKNRAYKYIPTPVLERDP